MQFAQHVKCRSERFGAVVFDTLNERVYVTNETGKHILEMVAEGTQPDEIPRRLKEQYEGDESEIAADADAFIQELISAGFLVETQAEAER